MLATTLAMAEGYPDLKADTNFLQLQHELVNTEDRIQAPGVFIMATYATTATGVNPFPAILWQIYSTLRHAITSTLSRLCALRHR